MALNKWDEERQTEQKHIYNAGQCKKEHRYYPVVEFAECIPCSDTESERHGIYDGTHNIHYQRVFRYKFVSPRKDHEYHAYAERYPRRGKR